MKRQPLVIKLGGNDLVQPGFVDQLAEVIRSLSKTYACILVHGGGRVIDDWMARTGLEPQYVDGQRVTDEAVLEIAEMVLSGQINKVLVTALLKAGIDSLGMSGVDRGLIRVEQWAEDMPRVGRIIEVRTQVLTDLCEQGVLPVISPISIGPEGRYNVNADHVAGMLAGAVNAPKTVFITNVPGVQVDGELMSHLTQAQIKQLIATGEIFGGMIPKVNAAVNALSCGVPEVLITNLKGLKSGNGTSILVEGVKDIG